MPIGEKMSDQEEYVSMLLWGREGTGKTTDGFRLLEVGPGNLVVINAEAGAKKTALTQFGVDPDRVEIWPTTKQGGPGYITYDRIIEEVVEPMRQALLADPHAYVGILVDSGTEVARRILEDVRSQAYDKAQRLGKNRGRWHIGLEDHGDAASQMRSLLRELRDLPVHLVITALERRDVDQDTSTVSYGPAFGPSVQTDTTGLVDVVGYVQVEEIGGAEFRTATFTQSVNRRAKDRFHKLPVSLVDPYADRIIGYIRGDITRDNDPERARLMAAIAGTKPQDAVHGEAPQDAVQPDENETDADAVGSEEAKVA